MPPWATSCPNPAFEGLFSKLFTILAWCDTMSKRMYVGSFKRLHRCKNQDVLKGRPAFLENHSGALMIRTMMLQNATECFCMLQNGSEYSNTLPNTMMLQNASVCGHVRKPPLGRPIKNDLRLCDVHCLPVRVFSTCPPWVVFAEPTQRNT